MCHTQSDLLQEGYIFDKIFLKHMLYDPFEYIGLKNHLFSFREYVTIFICQFIKPLIF